MGGAAGLPFTQRFPGVLVLIREFVFSTDDCIIISDETAKALRAWRKKIGYIFSPIKLKMISEMIGHLPFAMRSALSS